MVEERIPAKSFMTTSKQLHFFSSTQYAPLIPPNMDHFPWDQVNAGDLDGLHLLLFSSSTSRRIRCLQDLRDRNGLPAASCGMNASDDSAPDSELPQETRQDLLDLLFKTYAFYVDRPSRQLVHQCLRSLLRSASSDDLKYLAQKLQNETARPGLAPASAFALLEWCSTLLQLLKDDSSAPLSIALDIILADARALEICLGAAPKSALKHSAFVVARRSLRAAFSSGSWGEDAVRQSVARLTSDSSAGQRNAPFLGVVSGVCARLPTKRPVLQESKKPILEFYAREVVSSRTAVPPHVADGLGDFFSSFVTYDDIVSGVAPALEKAILRSPEAVLSGLIPPLCSSLPLEVDLSEVLHSRLLKHLLSSMKSNNATIRQGAADAFQSLLSRSQTESWLLKITKEVLGPLKSITNHDQRAAHAQALSAVSPSADVSKELVQGLVPVLSKESNEAALEQELNAFCKHLTLLLQSSVKTSDDVANAIVKGSSDKRIPFRRLWQLSVGEVLWNCDTKTLAAQEVEPLVSKFISKMKELFNEVASNPLPSAQSGSLSTAYIYLSLFERMSNDSKAAWESTVGQSMTLSPKPSFLLNPRAYSKLTSQGEVQWIVRGLTAATSGSKFEAADDASKVAWAHGFIYAITASGLPTYFREQAVHALSDAHLKKPELVGRIVIDALWTWMLASRTAEKESAAVSAGPGSEKQLHLVAKALCPPASKLQELGSFSTLQSQLVELLVLCRPELVPNVSWISLCLRTGTDPGNLARENADKCMNQLTRVLEVSLLHDCR